MGKQITPKVFLIGETRILYDDSHNSQGLFSLLEHLGASGWYSDAETDQDALTEIYGRACYKSFGTKLNPNITQVRRHNSDYILNTLQKGDGSIFEHCVTNWFFADVSRVFTHELVRHRAGTAISQESLRFLRLTDLDYYIPQDIANREQMIETFVKAFAAASHQQESLAEALELDSGLTFDQKKKLTSAMRRLAPMGLATNIGWSANFRTLRHVIEQRTAPSAEEEIRLVFAKVAEISCERWPNIFQDYFHLEMDGIDWYRTTNKKV